MRLLLLFTFLITLLPHTAYASCVGLPPAPPGNYVGMTHKKTINMKQEEYGSLLYYKGPNKQMSFNKYKSSVNDLNQTFKMAVENRMFVLKAKRAVDLKVPSIEPFSPSNLLITKIALIGQKDFKSPQAPYHFIGGGQYGRCTIKITYSTEEEVDYDTAFREFYALFSIFPLAYLEPEKFAIITKRFEKAP